MLATQGSLEEINIFSGEIDLNIKNLWGEQIKVKLNPLLYPHCSLPPTLPPQA